VAKERRKGRKEKERLKERGKDEHTGVERKTAFQQTFSMSGNQTDTYVISTLLLFKKAYSLYQLFIPNTLCPKWLQ